MLEKDIDIHNNDNTPQLDYESLKTKLAGKIMGRSNIGQTRLSELTGISQSRISACLNINNSDFFTFEQLYKICCVLGMSIDEITGLKELQNKNNVPSLSTACGALCDLHRIMPLEVRTIEVNPNEQRIALVSKYKTCDSMLAEFKKVSSIDSDILSLWEANYKDKNKDKLRRYDFNSYGQYIWKWLDNWVNEMRDFSINVYNARKNPSYTCEPSNKLDAAIIDGESVYSVFERALNHDLDAIYINIDNYIKTKNYPESSIEYISLSIFKKIYEKKQKFKKNEINYSN